VDAVDPSEEMIRAAQRAGGDEPIRWIVGRAEDAPLAPPYGLITAGASIHWMDPEVVMPRFRTALAPGARLAIVDTTSVYPEGEPWRAELVAVIQRYSPSHHDDLAALLKELETSGRFVREGEHATAPVPYEQSVDDYMAALASTSSLSRVTLGDRFDDFAREARAVLARHGIERIRAVLVASVIWGRPR
jgi:SAM-dependent methyltransferase